MKLRIFGDGLDALILGFFLTKQKISFEWITTKTKSGGYFAGGISCSGKPIDIGMVLLEPNSFNSIQSPLVDFRGEEGHAARAYIDDAYSFLEESLGSTDEIPIRVKNEEGGILSDYFISDSLECFSFGNEVMREQLLENLEWLGGNHGWHPKNKQSPDGVLSTVGIATYYKRIYGEEIYKRFFQGYLENLLGEKIEFLSANLHRRAWTPLYWPETLVSHIKGETDLDGLFQPKFTRPSLGSVAKWVNAMSTSVTVGGFGKIRKVDQIDVKEFHNFDLETDFAFLDCSILDGTFEKNRMPVVSNFVSLRIIHFCVDHSENQVMFLNRNENGCFRYSSESSSSQGIGGVTFEFGESCVEIDDETLLATAKNMCQDLNFKPVCQGTLFKGKLPLGQTIRYGPTDIPSEAFNSFTFHSSRGTSINDNIVRGAAASLKIMRKMS